MNRECAIDDIKDHNWDTNDDKKTCVDVLNEVFDFFEEQIQGLQSLLDLKQQEISVLESKVCELEANEEKLKREWYVMGSNDNFKALLDSGAIQQ